LLGRAEQVVADAALLRERAERLLSGERPAALGFAEDADSTEKRHAREPERNARAAGVACVRSREARCRLLETLEIVVLQELRPDEQPLDVRVDEDVRELASPEERVDRHDEGADPRRCEPGDDPIDAVRHQNPDARALADAVREEAARETARALLDFGVG